MLKRQRKAKLRGNIDHLFIEIRKKLGLTQAQAASMLGISRSTVAHIETGRFSSSSKSNIMLANMYIHFHELETGKQSADRSLETRLFLNDEYRKILPAMEKQEKEYRSKMIDLEAKMAKMKEQARDAEHAIIVFTKAINDVENLDKQDRKTAQKLTGLNYWKEQAYEKLLTCWEPAQAALQTRIEALAGEAKALRSYRLTVMKQHDPFKKKKSQQV